MDFLKEIKAKLEEFEELNREAQQGAAPQSVKDLFQPKTQGPSIQPEVAPPQAPSRFDKKKVERSSLRKESEFQSVNFGRQMRPEAPSVKASEPDQPSIFEDLAGRLDEAFLLQEVLGPPRCVREWE